MIALVVASLMAIMLVVWITNSLFETMKQEDFDSLKQVLTIFVPSAVVAAVGFVVLSKAKKQR